ncbi:hypothetical protein MUK42_34690, partial [Musa troglodytarum]
ISSSFFLPSTISSNRSSSCPTRFSVPDLSVPNHPFNPSTFSRRPLPLPAVPSGSRPSVSPFSISSLSSSADALAARNSCMRIPGRPPSPSTSPCSLCRSRATETAYAELEHAGPWKTPCSGLQYTDPHSRICKRSELAFLSA